jgi:hypothetical protein
MAQPTKLTPALQERIGVALRAGATHLHAAEYAGISEKTFYEWMNTKSEFREYIHAREAEAAITLMALVQRSAQQDWRAAAWILEHRWPQDYAVSRIDIHHSGEVQVNLDARLDMLTRLREAVAQVFAGDQEVLDRVADALAVVEEQPPPTPMLRRGQRCGQSRPRSTSNERAQHE